MQNCVRFEFVQYTSKIHRTEVLERFVLVFLEPVKNSSELGTLYSTLLFCNVHIGEVLNLFSCSRRELDNAMVMNAR